MNIQALEHSDINLIDDLLPLGWGSAIPAIDYYTQSSFCFPIKVTIDTKIVGIGTTIIHNDTAWLAHIMVHPEYRNQSIGKLITQTLVEISNSKHCDIIYLLATDLGEPVYRKIGFETETEYVFFKGESISSSFINSENIVAINADHHHQISKLDQQVSGEDRMFHLQPHLTNGFVYIEDKDVKGFYLPTFGDGLIIATTNSAGLELMKLRLTSKDFASFPIENVNAIEFMHLNNFKVDRKQKRMRLGKERSWQPENIYNRVGGNLG